jgi:membrane-associated protease RseP (regulator of RpoE activity)
MARMLLLHGGLFLLTFASVTFTYLLGFGGGGLLGEQVSGALAFATALLGILGAHEMGHYWQARRHGVDSTLPYFIPLPLLGFGTLGAVIRIRSRIPHRDALVDIGAAGPLAGLLVALPVLVVGLLRSRWIEVPLLEGRVLGQSLWDLVHHWRAGVKEPAHGWLLIYGDNLLIKGLQRLVLGPAPAGHELLAHPLVLAGWFGTLVTALNLVPVGQLDGGHLTHALLGRAARPLGMAVTTALVGVAAFVSASWLPWVVVTSVLVGFRHPSVGEAERPLSPGRLWICAACLAAFVVCFLPVPLSLVPAP